MELHPASMIARTMIILLFRAHQQKMTSKHMSKVAQVAINKIQNHNQGIFIIGDAVLGDFGDNVGKFVGCAEVTTDGVKVGDNEEKAIVGYVDGAIAGAVVVFSIGDIDDAEVGDNEGTFIVGCPDGKTVGDND